MSSTFSSCHTSIRVYIWRLESRSTAGAGSSLAGVTLLYSGVKKITCPGARDKLNFRQDKHIFSPNVRRTSKKFSASLFDNIFRTS